MRSASDARVVAKYQRAYRIACRSRDAVSADRASFFQSLASHCQAFRSAMFVAFSAFCRHLSASLRYLCACVSDFMAGHPKVWSKTRSLFALVAIQSELIHTASDGFIFYHEITPRAGRRPVRDTQSA